MNPLRIKRVSLLRKQCLVKHNGFRHMGYISKPPEPPQYPDFSRSGKVTHTSSESFHISAISNLPMLRKGSIVQANGRKGIYIYSFVLYILTLIGVVMDIRGKKAVSLYLNRNSSVKTNDPVTMLNNCLELPQYSIDDLFSGPMNVFDALGNSDTLCNPTDQFPKMAMMIKPKGFLNRKPVKTMMHSSMPSLDLFYPVGLGTRSGFYGYGVSEKLGIILRYISSSLLINPDLFCVYSCIGKSSQFLQGVMHVFKSEGVLHRICFVASESHSLLSHQV